MTKLEKAGNNIKRNSEIALKSEKSEEEKVRKRVGLKKYEKIKIKRLKKSLKG